MDSTPTKSTQVTPSKTASSSKTVKPEPTQVELLLTAIIKNFDISNINMKQVAMYLGVTYPAASGRWHRWKKANLKEGAGGGADEIGGAGPVKGKAKGKIVVDGANPVIPASGVGRGKGKAKVVADGRKKRKLEEDAEQGEDDEQVELDHFAGKEDQENE